MNLLAEFTKKLSRSLAAGEYRVMRQIFEEYSLGPDEVLDSCALQHFPNGERVLAIKGRGVLRIFPPKVVSTFRRGAQKYKITQKYERLDG